MKKVQVLIPFRYKDKLYQPPKKTTLPDDVIGRLQKINVNMVLVLGEVEEPEKK